MKKQPAIVLALVTALGLGGAVMAQTTPSTGTGSASSASTTAKGAMAQGMLASSLIGMTVYSTSGEQIGEIHDLVVEPQSGQAKTAIIGVGGFLGIGEKDVAIDMAQMQMVKEADDATPRLTLNTTKEQLSAAPAFDRSALRGGQADDSATGSTGSTQPQQ